MHLDKTMRLLPVFAATLIFAGCAPEPAHWSDIESPKVNTVAYTTQSYRVHFAPGAAAPSQDASRGLADFATTLHAGDRVTVEIGRSGRGRDLAERRRAALAKLLAARSVDVAAELSRVEGATALPDEAILRVGRYVVTPPHCPDWSKPESNDFTNTPSSNFGCAVTADLGLMVADPGDLVRGAGSGRTDAVFAARGVDEYRSGAISKSLAGVAASPSAGGGSGGGG